MNDHEDDNTRAAEFVGVPLEHIRIIRHPVCKQAVELGATASPVALMVAVEVARNIAEGAGRRDDFAEAYAQAEALADQYHDAQETTGPTIAAAARVMLRFGKDDIATRWLPDGRFEVRHRHTGDAYAASPSAEAWRGFLERYGTDGKDI